MLRDDAGATPQALQGTAVACAVTPWTAQGGALPPDSPAQNTVIEEVPVALVYNGISHAVMLATPADLEDFAVGFSLSEDIVRHAREVHDLEVVATGQGIEVQLTIASERMAGLKERRRALAGRTGCGLCGIETLAQAVRPARAVPPGGQLTLDALDAAIACLDAGQTLHHATGAAHAAGFADWDGRLRLWREDVGRHNALDKLIGAMARERIDGTQGFALVTSRASYEMVQKTASAGIGLLAALSAPTAMAVRTAQACGLTLIGFAGRNRRLAYSHPQRMVRTL